MQTTSIQRRLIAVVVISQLLLAAGLVSVAVYFTRRQLRNAFDVGLQGRAMSIAALVRYSEEERPSLIFEGDLVPLSLQPGHPDLYEVTTPGGRLIARSPSWPQDLDARWEGEGDRAEFSLGPEKYRGLRLQNVPVLDREGDKPSSDFLTVTYAAPTAEMSRAVVHAGIYTGLASLLLLCIAVFL